MLSELQELSFRLAKIMGFHDDLPMDRHGTLVRLCLVHTEIEEVLEAMRNQTEAVGEECADILIRVADLAQGIGIDLASGVSPLAPMSIETLQKHAHSLMRKYLLYRDERGNWTPTFWGDLLHRYTSAAAQVVKRYGVHGTMDTAVTGHLSRLVICVAALGEQRSLDLTCAVMEKLEKNATRPYRYGTPEERQS